MLYSSKCLFLISSLANGVQVMGFFVFGGVKATVFILLGVTFNTAGGVWYTAIKFKEKHMKERTVITEQHNGSKVGWSSDGHLKKLKAVDNKVLFPQLKQFFSIKQTSKFGSQPGIW